MFWKILTSERTFTIVFLKNQGDWLKGSVIMLVFKKRWSAYLVNIFSPQIKLQSIRWQFPIINCLDINFLSLFVPDLIIPNNLSFNNFRTKTTRSWEIPRNEYTVQILVLFPTRKLQQENVWRIQKHSMGGRKTRIPVNYLNRS